uniref:peptidoglycan recognition protein family protein n=1 Tax=Eubacterium cellulosolvens TaxID=29322 RepID=UPI000484BA05|nr:peptidoglycan recognition family protein [[Eubacterium] cellulosolvens]
MKKKKKKISGRVRFFLFALLLIVVAVFAFKMKEYHEQRAAKAKAEREARQGQDEDPRGEEFWQGAPELKVDLLTPNQYSRPQLPLMETNAIVIHYTANPGTTAKENRDYFESLKHGTSGAHVSSHFVIGLDGEIVQCIPCSEMSYASNDRNTDSIAIECCHPDETGEFTDETYASCVKLTAWLCKAFHVSPENVIRHYDITGKDCPRYYVENEDAWKKMKEDISERYTEIRRDY